VTSEPWNSKHKVFEQPAPGREPPPSWEKAYRDLREEWREKPIAYARHRLGLTPTHQQRDLLNAIKEPGAKVTARSGHGTGKSAALAVAIWWKLECFDFSKVPCTAPSAVQLRDILWAEISKWYRRSLEMSRAFGMPQEFWLSSLFEITQDKIAARGAPKEWFAVARTARPEQPDALQGFHASEITISEDGRAIVVEEAAAGTHKGQIMFVVEEAGGVHDKIFEVAEGALSSPNASLLMGGNPTRATGYFAASHKHNRAEFTTLHFRSADSPLVASDYRPGLVRKFGEGSNVVRVRADGDFPRTDDDTLIPLDAVEEAIRRPHDDAIGPGDRRLGVDVARYGDDRTVFILRDGPNLEHVRIEAKIDTMRCTGIIVNLIRQWHADSVHLDISGGLGAGPYDRLRELKRQEKLPDHVLILGVNVADKAPVRTNLATDYQPFRLRDWLWIEMADWIAGGNTSFAYLPRDTAEDLAGELCSVKFTIDSAGRLVIESKDMMKRRGLRSCDLADALGTTFFSSGVIGPGAALFEIVRRQAEAIRKAKEQGKEEANVRKVAA
jgi:phage terminase large subunit